MSCMRLRFTHRFFTDSLRRFGGDRVESKALFFKGRLRRVISSCARVPFFCFSGGGSSFSCFRVHTYVLRTCMLLIRTPGTCWRASCIVRMEMAALKQEEGRGVSLCPSPETTSVIPKPGRCFSLYRRKPRQLRYDFWPFVLLLSFCAYMLFNDLAYQDSLMTAPLSPSMPATSLPETQTSTTDIAIRRGEGSGKKSDESRRSETKESLAIDEHAVSHSPGSEKDGVRLDESSAVTANTSASTITTTEPPKSVEELFPILTWLCSSNWFFGFLACSLLCIFLNLSTHWFISLECAIAYTPVLSVLEATHVLVTPAPGKPLESRTLCKLIHSPEQIYFFFRKKKFLLDQRTGLFHPLQYPKDLPLSVYVHWRGLQNALPHSPVPPSRPPHTPAQHCASREQLPRQLTPKWDPIEDSVIPHVRAKYGSNDYDIPIPTFKELFKEHAVSPFFVFQMFCISLWLLDEYWQYSLLTLVMLVLLECQMVKKRLKDFQQLRAMRIPPRLIHVLRSGQWVSLRTDELLPGDIFAITGGSANPDNAVCPVDALLLQGSVVVNESTLTGESIPQTKAALEAVDVGADDATRTKEKKERIGGEEEQPGHSCCLDMNKHKQHIIFAGTSVMLHRNETAHFAKTKVPEKACVGFVLRTAFTTTQGKLVRTILFSHGRVTVSSKEAWQFLGILLILALCASSYVLREGLQDANRSRFKLFLSCSHILMAVVPAEFPITLSLAVTMSLLYLFTQHIFCTEPFRVPYAGKVDVCAFDKTGTLTSDSTRVLGVYGVSPSGTNSRSGGKDMNGKKGREPSKAPTTSKHGIADGIEEKADKNHEGGRLRREGDKGVSEGKELQQGRRDDTLSYQALPFETIGVMGCCHSLALIDGKLLGDPTEKAAFEAVGWTLSSPDSALNKRRCFPPYCPQRGLYQDRLQVLKRFPFSSELQRMTVVARHEGHGTPWLGTGVADAGDLSSHSPGQREHTEEKGKGEDVKQKQQGGVGTAGAGPSVGKQQVSSSSPALSDQQRSTHAEKIDISSRWFVAAKGAPEMMKKFLRESPEFYDDLYKSLSIQGYRVLTLAYKYATESDIVQAERRRVEENLLFAGFLVVTCPIKSGTRSDIHLLHKAGHRTLMITGDSPLTACQVALDVGIFCEGAADAAHLEVGSEDDEQHRRRTAGGKGEAVVDKEKKEVGSTAGPFEDSRQLAFRGETWEKRRPILILKKREEHREGELSPGYKTRKEAKENGGGEAGRSLQQRRKTSMGQQHCSSFAGAGRSNAALAPVCSSFFWESRDGAFSLDIEYEAKTDSDSRRLDFSDLPLLSKQYHLCVTGPALASLAEELNTAATTKEQIEVLLPLLPYIGVYARMSPQQKELILMALNAFGYITLMCGDGTNDVGALKAAHVGVSLLCQEGALKSKAKVPEKTTLFCNRTAAGNGHLKRVQTNVSSKDQGNVTGRKGTSFSSFHSGTAVTLSAAIQPNRPSHNAARPDLNQYMENMMEQLDDDVPIVKLGDASIASPFTYKGDSICCIPRILRSGRATLVTVVMMYKLMSLNSVITAFALSVLTLDGVKLGDLQTTLENLLCTFLTLMISKSKPSLEMGSCRPISSVFHPTVFLSLVLQSSLHIYTLYTAWDLACALRAPGYKPNVDGQFEPNLVNSVVFLLIASMHASTFLSNYEGAPFMTPLFQNRPLCTTLAFLVGTLLLLVFEVFPEFNAWLSLVPFPNQEFKQQIVSLVFLDLGGAWLVGWLLRQVGWWWEKRKAASIQAF